MPRLRTVGAASAVSREPELAGGYAPRMALHRPANQKFGVFQVKSLTRYMELADEALTELGEDRSSDLRHLAVVMIIGHLPDWIVMDRVQAAADSRLLKKAEKALESLADCSQLSATKWLRAHVIFAKHALPKKVVEAAEPPLEGTPVASLITNMSTAHTHTSEVGYVVPEPGQLNRFVSLGELATSALREARELATFATGGSCECLFHRFLREHPPRTS